MQFAKVSRCLRTAPFALTVLTFGLVVWPRADAQAQSASDRAHTEEVLRGLNRGRGVGQVALSPDGKRLAWIEGGRGGGEIRVAPLDDLKSSVRVTAAKTGQSCREGDLAWEPDSKAIAFFSDCGSSDGQLNLYIAGAGGGEARRVTELKGYVHEAAFSPDGSKVAFL